jgi:hypothetical protein
VLVTRKITKKQGETNKTTKKTKKNILNSAKRNELLRIESYELSHRNEIFR